MKASLLQYRSEDNDGDCTGLECSTVKKSGLVRNLALGDWSSSVRRDLELGWVTVWSLRSSTHTHTHTQKPARSNETLG